MAEADPGILQSVANANNKTLGEAGAYAMATMFQTVALATQEYAAGIGRRGGLLDAAMGQMANKMSSLDVNEATAMAKALQADNRQAFQELGAMVAQLQQMMKGAQTTPPNTSVS